MNTHDAVRPADHGLADPEDLRPAHRRARGPQGPRRQEIIARISAARDEGDLKENGGYHAAKDEQGKIEAPIRQLEEMLEHGRTETPADDGVVAPGKVVTYRFAGDDEDEKFLLGAREIEDDYDDQDFEVFSPQSPLGAALIGATQGRHRRVRGPQRQDPADRDRRRGPLHRLRPSTGRSG